MVNLRSANPSQKESKTSDDFSPARSELLSPLALFLGLLLFSMLVGGCATPAISTVTFSPTGKGQHQSKDGLEVEAELVCDKATLKSLFGREDLGDSVLAVYVQITNNIEGKMFIVQPQNFQLALGQTSNTVINEGAGKTASTVGGGVTLAGVTSVPLELAGLAAAPLVLAPIGMPVLLAGVSSQAKETVLRNNLVRREFKTATLQPGASASGFLFFKLPPGTAMTDVRFEATLIQAGTDAKVDFKLDLNL